MCFMQVKGEGRDMYKFECVPDYACLFMYFHTIYIHMLCTCKFSVSAFVWLCTTIYYIQYHT